MRPGSIAGHDQIKEQKKKEILETIPEYATLASVAKKVGITYRSLCLWRNEDPKFFEDCEEAITERDAVLEETLRDWAIKGKTRTQYDKDGNITTEINEPCERILLAAVQAANPEKYNPIKRQQFLDGQGNPTNPIQPILVVPSMIDHDQWLQHADAQRERAVVSEQKQMIALGEMKENEQQAS